MPDFYQNAGGGLNDQARKLVLVTPGAADLTPTNKGLMILSAGDVTVIPIDNANNEPFTFTGLYSNTFIPIIARRVTAATATVAAVIG